MTTYPTRQPITTANIEAAIAERIARLFPSGEIPRVARLRLRVTKFTAAAQAAIVEQMAEVMRMFGEGMTEMDLKREGFTEDQIRHCARQAGDRAMQRAAFN